MTDLDRLVAVDPTGTGTAASFVVEDASGDNVFNGTVTNQGRTDERSHDLVVTNR